MENEIVEHGNNPKNAKNVFMGLLFGGLVGAVATLLFAPQSGKRTRSEIQQKTIQLRDQTTLHLEKAVAQIRSGTARITAEVREKASDLKQIGQDKLIEGLDRMSAALDPAKKPGEVVPD